MKHQDKLIQSINQFGTATTLSMCMEECAELIQAISKYMRYGRNDTVLDNLTEECADVQIAIKYLQLICAIPKSEISNKKHIKMQRLERMLQQMRNGKDSKVLDDNTLLS